MGAQEAKAEDQKLSVWLSRTFVREFIDKDFAQKTWRETETLDDFLVQQRKYCATESAQVLDKIRKEPMKRMKYVKAATYIAYYKEVAPQIPDRDALARCIDLHLVASLWNQTFVSFYPIDPYSPAPVVEWPTLKAGSCETYLKRNVLARDCGDVPDWRSDEGKAYDKSQMQFWRQNLAEEARRKGSTN